MSFALAGDAADDFGTCGPAETITDVVSINQFGVGQQRCGPGPATAVTPFDPFDSRDGSITVSFQSDDGNANEGFRLRVCCALKEPGPSNIN